ncbi:hypothetical protein QBC43DRAFT_31918 [Cladorrhinum sp. PSN259]|nr:hypothetical protein QBC43DRAFT_31918 [Cladorrhinum sp. PSN259]
MPSGLSPSPSASERGERQNLHLYLVHTPTFFLFVCVCVWLCCPHPDPKSTAPTDRRSIRDYAFVEIHLLKSLNTRPTTPFLLPRQVPYPLHPTFALPCLTSSRNAPSLRFPRDLLLRPYLISGLLFFIFVRNVQNLLTTTVSCCLIIFVLFGRLLFALPCASRFQARNLSLTQKRQTPHQITPTPKAPACSDFISHFTNANDRLALPMSQRFQ